MAYVGQCASKYNHISRNLIRLLLSLQLHKRCCGPVQKLNIIVQLKNMLRNMFSQQCHKVFIVHAAGPQQCRGITERLKTDQNYVCPRCKGNPDNKVHVANILAPRTLLSGMVQSIDGRTVTEVNVNVTMLDVESTSWYLSDMLSSAGYCDSAIVLLLDGLWPGEVHETLACPNH